MSTCNVFYYTLGMYSCGANAGVFPSAWYANVRQIASKSPLLLSMGAEQYLDKELEINHPLKIENIAPVRIVLFQLVPTMYFLCLSFFRLSFKQLV